MTMQHEILAAKSARLLDRQHVGRRLDHAQQGRVAPGILADAAQRLFGQRTASLAVADLLDRLDQRF